MKNLGMQKHFIYVIHFKTFLCHGHKTNICRISQYMNLPGELQVCCINTSVLNAGKTQKNINAY